MNELPPTPLQTCEDVARELLSQPALFLEFDGVEGFTPPPQTVQRYTGERSTADEQRMLKVGALRLLGASDRQIEHACGVTRRTIPLLLAQLEKSGRITPLKTRLAMLCGDNAERSNIALRHLLDKVETESASVELASMIKAVATALGISTQNTLLLTGQATEIVETRVAAGREEFEAWWRQSVRPIEATVTRPSESMAPAAPPIPVESEPVPPPGHEPDTDGPREGGPPRGGGDLDAAGGANGPTG